MATCCDIHNHEESHHDHQSDVSQAIVLSEVFWPEFVYHDERIYLDAAPDSDDYLELLLACEYDKTTVQALCNHRHLLEYCLATDAKNTPTREQLIAFGHRLQAMWQAKLAQDFPNLNVIVAFDAQDEDPLDDLQIVVYQEDAE
ncbi:MAG: hypothetical protein KGO49_02375 [Gammaproteobacteria bacterium]|nr:hypothetical protein [Gammaproteobacteria bacterium]